MIDIRKYSELRLNVKIHDAGKAKNETNHRV